MASKSTSAYPVSPPRKALKRSASNASLASLPTPPRTYRRRGRGRSRGSCDSDSDSDDAGRRHHTPEILTEDEIERAGHAEPKRKKRRVALAQEKDDEEAFWLGGSTGHHNDEEQEEDSAQSGQDDGGKPSKSSATTLKRQAPLLYRKLQASASSTSSQTEQGLLSPPASHRKPTAVKTLEVASKTTLTTIEELPVTPRKAKAKKVSPPALGAKTFVDSPSNPFLETPVDSRLVLSSDSEGEDAEPSKEKEVPEYDKPTVTYVFRGVKRVYQNPMFDHAKNRPVTPPPNSKLPVNDPLYSPDPTCKPRLLFPEAHKRRNKARAAKTAAAEKVKTVKNKMVAIDSDSDDGGRGESSVRISQPKFVPKAKAKKAAPPAAEDDLFA